MWVERSLGPEARVRGQKQVCTWDTHTRDTDPGQKAGKSGIGGLRMVGCEAIVLKRLEGGWL